MGRQRLFNLLLDEVPIFRMLGMVISNDCQRENETLLAVQAGANADSSARQRHGFGPLDSAPGLSPVASERVLRYLDPEQLYCG